jgi:hypothetical protein
MTSVIVLGAIVLLLYLFIRLCATTGAWLSGARYRSYRQLARRYYPAAPWHPIRMTLTPGFPP